MKTLFSKRSVTALLLALAMLFALAACGSQPANDQTPANNDSQQSGTTPADKTEPEKEPEKESEKEPEAGPVEEPAGLVTITDMSGDEVTIEGEVRSIVNLWPAGTSSFFVMGAGDLISGLAVNSPATMNSWTQLFYPRCTDIPELGGTTPAVEELAKIAPDLVIVHPSSAKDGYPQQIREIGIPAININFKDYATMTQAYTVLGTILGGDYQKKLDGWCAEIAAKQARNQDLLSALTEDDRPVVYYIAGQQDSLTVTMSKGSIIQDWIETCGGRFASAVMDLDGQEVTAEQVFALNPDIIIVGGTSQHLLMKELQEEDGWKDLNAVKSGRVYNNPYGCFNWDRFGLESCLQLDYALMCIQPEIAAENGIDRDYMTNAVMDFYARYNGTELTEEQAGFMLDGLGPDGAAEIPA